MCLCVSRLVVNWGRSNLEGNWHRTRPCGGQLQNPNLQLESAQIVGPKPAEHHPAICPQFHINLEEKKNETELNNNKNTCTNEKKTASQAKKSIRIAKEKIQATYQVDKKICQSWDWHIHGGSFRQSACTRECVCHVQRNTCRRPNSNIYSS